MSPQGIINIVVAILVILAILDFFRIARCVRRLLGIVERQEAALSQISTLLAHQQKANKILSAQLAHVKNIDEILAASVEDPQEQ